ncbi:MAG: hypothetical protein V4772_08885 [Pseudomonadota bacterium]
MRTKTQVRAETIKLGDWLFVNGVASPVLAFSEPHEVFKFPARTAITNQGSLTIIDGEMVDVLAYVIEGMVYFDKHSHDAAKASQDNTMRLQIKHYNPNYF